MFQLEFALSGFIIKYNFDGKQETCSETFLLVALLDLLSLYKQTFIRSELR